LNDIFQHAYTEGKIPNEATAKYLVSQLAEVNYIPDKSIRDYEHAVLKQYQEYFEGKEKRKAKEISEEK
jgi:hypothetical protein